LDEDVAVQLERIRRSRNASLKEVVNEALRQGLGQMTAKPRPRTPFRTKTVLLGPCLIGGVDDVAEALVLAEGENLK
jgi:hypothetical protein